jgi:hypothetical protein
MRIDPAVVAMAADSPAAARAPLSESTEAPPKSSSDDVQLAFG